MGDLVCELVAVDWNIRHFPNIKFHVWVPDYLLEFAIHVLPKGSKVRPFSKAKSKFRHDILGMTTEWCTNHTCIRTHPVDYGFHMLCDRHVYDLNEKNYLQIRPEEIVLKRFKLPESYIVIGSTGVEPIRTMPVETANEIIYWARSKNITPVFLGKESSDCGFNDFKIKAETIPLRYSAGLNLVNKTSLLESAAIIQGSKAFVGMDGGLAHVAGCTDSQIVCGFTASSPTHVAPIRNGSQSYKFQAIEPDERLPNRYFQTFSSFRKGNFQKFEGWEKVKASMTPDKFIAALEKVV